MNRSRILVLGGLLTAALIAPVNPALADQKEHFEHHPNQGKHLGWDKTAGKKFDEHDRRYYRHPDPRFHHSDSVRKAGLRQDYSELRKDRVELHRDMRNGASKAEILKDRQEIRSDLKDIHSDRLDLRRGK
jgi:hypothetical protein